MPKVLVQGISSKSISISLLTKRNETFSGINIHDHDHDRNFLLNKTPVHH